jgi:hypothetical protein
VYSRADFGGRFGGGDKVSVKLNSPPGLLLIAAIVCWLAGILIGASFGRTSSAASILALVIFLLGVVAAVAGIVMAIRMRGKTG